MSLEKSRLYLVSSSTESAILPLVSTVAENRQTKRCLEGLLYFIVTYCDLVLNYKRQEYWRAPTLLAFSVFQTELINILVSFIITLQRASPLPSLLSVVAELLQLHTHKPRAHTHECKQRTEIRSCGGDTEGNQVKNTSVQQALTCTLKLHLNSIGTAR